ncbi:MAG: sensor histidine kinase [Vicinamibacterales bacterium]
MDILEPVDGTDTRVFLWAYAALAAIGGFLLLTDPGPVALLLASSANGSYSLIFVCGAALVGSGLTAIGLSTIPNVLHRRRALGWFGAAHAVVLGMLFIQWKAVWPWGLADWLVVVAGVATLALFYAWSTALGNPSWWTRRPTSLRQVPGTDTVRTRYEQQIRAIAAQEERHRLARDLHDSVKQQIFAIQTAAATVEARLESDPAGAIEAIETIRASARDAMGEMEAVTDHLKTGVLGTDALLDAIRRQAEALRLRTGAAVDLHMAALPPVQILPPGTPDALFRAVQEACANIARHARATRVRIALEPVGTDLRLTIADDGTGIGADEGSAGSGIQNMRARASELGGRFAIQGGSTGGTVVTFVVPIESAAPNQYVEGIVMNSLGFVVLAALILVLPWRSGRPNWAIVPMLIVPAFEILRYSNAWRRASRLRSAAA